MDVLGRVSYYLLRVPQSPPPSAPGEDARVLRPDARHFHCMAVRWIATAAAIAAMYAALGMSLAAVLVAVLGHVGIGRVAAVSAAIAAASALLAAHLAASFLLLRMDFLSRWYIVGNTSVRTREGVLWMMESTMTYANVQAVSLSQGPLQRLFGVSDVRLDSAGGGPGAPAGTSALRSGLSSGHRVVIAGMADAEPLRAWIAARVEAARGAGLGERHADAAPARDARPLAEAAALLQKECAAFRRAAEAAAAAR